MPARSASSSATRVPSTFARHSACGCARKFVIPPTWNTRSTPRIPRGIVEAEDIRLVSLYVNWPGIQEREVDMADFDDFYDRLRAARDLPTTSQPSIGDFLAVYEPLLAEGRDIVSIHLAGGISGTVEAARQAAAQCAERGRGGRIEVIDSATACGGFGLLALGAARTARAGA